MKKSLRYTGKSTIREISDVDMKRAWGIDAKSIRIDTRISRLVTVDEELALYLLEQPDFQFVSDIAEKAAPAPEDPAAPIEPEILTPETPDKKSTSAAPMAKEEK